MQFYFSNDLKLFDKNISLNKIFKFDIIYIKVTNVYSQ